MKRNLLISSTLIKILLFFSLTKLIYFYIFFIILIGISACLGIVIPGKNLCYYYLSRRGLITSCTQSCMTLIWSFISTYGEKSINLEEIVLKDGEIYCPFEVC